MFIVFLIVPEEQVDVILTVIINFIFLIFFILTCSIFLPELISPEDLLQACAIWEKFDVYAQQNLQLFSGF